MKSTFKKDYQRTEQPDGTVVLEFKGSAVGGQVVGALGGIAAFAILIVALFAAVSLSIVTHQAFSPVALVVIAGILLFFLVRFLKRSGVLRVKPHVGVAWGRHQLPFSDISSIGLMKESANGLAYVFAETGGRMVKLTGYMPMARAEAIRAEIQSLSGIAWG